MIFEIARLMGPQWLIQRLFYEVKRRSGWLQKKTPVKAWNQTNYPLNGNYFQKNNVLTPWPIATDEADKILSGTFSFFSKHPQKVGFPPSWFSNPFITKEHTSSIKNIHWSKIDDFSQGDIKGVWELGRFAWAYPLVSSYKSSEDERYARAFWDLFSDWMENNPPNTGVHWKCGQEISIRMFAVVSAYFALVSAKATGPEQKKQVENLLFESAKRIESNIGYALSQKNNHGISEAAGLFTAGLLLIQSKWTKKGKSLLERQAKELIYEDGSFSQHSANYHRLMLQVYLWAIQLGRANCVDFSHKMIARIRLAGQWLKALHDPLTGRMPNLGSNDGALVFPVTECDYLDYRPTIQAVGAVVDGEKWIDSGPWDGFAEWLGAEIRDQKSEVRDQKTESTSRDQNAYKTKNTVIDLKIFKDGGYAVLTRKNTKLIYRCPESFRHRPAQCDLLHVDLWHDGINLFRDGGTYSYNCEPPWQDYFKSVQAHNTVQFDDHDQMPKISRFLYGKWPKISVESNCGTNLSYVMAEFTDWKGCSQHRKVEVGDKSIQVKDRISRFNNNAVLRWRLAPELEWSLSNNVCTSPKASLTITVDKGLKGIRLVQGWESLYYMERTPLQVLEVLQAEESLASAIADSIRPAMMPEIEIYSHKNKPLLVLRVFHWKGPFYLKADGPVKGVYVRLGSTNRQAGPEILAELHRSMQNRSFDQLPCPDLSIKALDIEKIQRVFAVTGQQIDEKKLESLELLVPHAGGLSVSNGGLILFGLDDVRQRYFPDARVSCARFRGTDKSEFIDRIDIDGSVLNAIYEVPRFIRRNTRLAAKIENMHRKDIPEYPDLAIREILVNAIGHADYSLSGMRILIGIYADRMEIQNPGMLPFGMTMENLKAGVSKIRNRVIARVFREMGLMEEWGSGYKRVIHACQQRGQVFILD